VDPDTVDLHEFQLWQQSTVAQEDLAGVGQMQVGLANEVFRAAVPSVQETMGEDVGQAMFDSLPDTYKAAAARSEETPERPAPASSVPPPAEPVMPATAPSSKAQAEKSPKRDRVEAGRNTRPETAVDRQEPPHGPPNGASQVAAVGDMLKALAQR